MEITKEQIKKLDKGEVNLRELFPEVFEVKLEVGKWYKSKSERGCTFAFFQGFDVKTYGIAHYGDWVSKAIWFNKKGGIIYDNFGNNLEYLQLATKEEVETALINEAVRRGFKQGYNITNVNNKVIGIIKYDLKFKLFDNRLLLTHCVESSLEINQEWTIFKNGAWSEIIEPEITHNGQKYILKV